MKVQLNPTIVSMIETLRRTGLYGSTREQVAERLICAQLREIVIAGRPARKGAK